MSLYPRHRHVEFLKTVAAYPGQELHVVCDNHATHKDADVRKWLRHPENQRITLHFVPTRCSWLNLVECFFSVITRQAIRRGTFTSVKELIAAIALSSTPGTTTTPAAGRLGQGRRRGPRQRGWSCPGRGWPRRARRLRTRGASAAHDAAERGQVIYLTDPQGRRIAAIVPASVAAAGAAAIGALEDAADVAAAEEALAEWEADDRRTYRLADVDAELSES